MKHHRRTELTALASVLAVVLILSTQQVGWAANDYDNRCHWGGTQGTTRFVYYRWGPSINVSGPEANGFRLANSDWNALPSLIRLYYSSSATNTLDVYYAPGDTKQGRTWQVCNWFYTYLMDSFDAKRNTAWPLDDWGNKAVGGHEIGHGLGLGHSYDTNAIMHDPIYVNTPGSDDLTGLNQYYY